MRKILLLSVFCSFAAHAALPEKSVDLWGTKFSWVSADKSNFNNIEKEITRVKSQSRAYDPDCFYGAKDKPCEKSPDEKTTTELDALSAEMKTETNGSFDIYREKDGKKLRDFGGIAQGYVLEKMKNQIKGTWAANFSGDIFISAPLAEEKPLTIEDYEVSGMRYADVTMKTGWMLGSSSPDFISKPGVKGKSNTEFYKIVLFAKPEFSGARLDAWSTGLITGGKTLLNKLWSDKKYEGQWAYFYVDNSGKPLCSTNLKCNLFGGNRSIVAPW